MGGFRKVAPVECGDACLQYVQPVRGGNERDRLLVDYLPQLLSHYASSPTNPLILSSAEACYEWKTSKARSRVGRDLEVQGREGR